MQNQEDSHYFFSSESVTEGHPDKICDIISDSILDACLAQDPNSKVAMETVAKSNMILLAGELTTSANINLDNIVRERIKETKVSCLAMPQMKPKNYSPFLI